MENSAYEVMVRDTAAQIAASESFGELINTAAQLELWSRELKVFDTASESVAAEGRAQLVLTRKRLEEKRLSAGAPYRKMTEAINGAFKGITELCDKALGRLDAALRAYRREREAELLAEAERKANEVPEIIGSCLAKLGQPVPSAPVQTDSGKLVEREVMKFEVVNALKLVKAAISSKNKVPFGVIRVDETRLRECVVAGILTEKEWEKLGVKVWKEKEFASRRV